MSKYAETWGTPLGQDCINLDTTMTRWLGHRLVFLGTHTNSYPGDYADLRAWRAALLLNGGRLLAYAENKTADNGDVDYEVTRDALRWVAEYLPALWD